jgi:predicted transcriptional regulator
MSTTQRSPVRKIIAREMAKEPRSSDYFVELLGVERSLVTHYFRELGARRLADLPRKGSGRRPGLWALPETPTQGAA